MRSLKALFRIGTGPSSSHTKALKPKQVDIIWKPDEELPLHTNGMLFEALDENGGLMARVEEYSVGGGALLSEPSEGKLYGEKNTAQILKAVENRYGTFWHYIEGVEGTSIYGFSPARAHPRAIRFVLRSDSMIS